MDVMGVSIVVIVIVPVFNGFVLGLIGTKSGVNHGL